MPVSKALRPAKVGYSSEGGLEDKRTKANQQWTSRRRPALKKTAAEESLLTLHTAKTDATILLSSQAVAERNEKAERHSVQIQLERQRLMVELQKLEQEKIKTEILREELRLKKSQLKSND